MAEANNTTITTGSIEALNEALNKASLQLDRAQGMLDTLYILACNGIIEDLNDKTLASVLDALIQIIENAKDLVDCRGAA